MIDKPLKNCVDDLFVSGVLDWKDARLIWRFSVTVNELESFQKWDESAICWHHKYLSLRFHITVLNVNCSFSQSQTIYEKFLHFSFKIAWKFIIFRGFYINRYVNVLFDCVSCRFRKNLNQLSVLILGEFDDSLDGLEWWLYQVGSVVN